MKHKSEVKEKLKYFLNTVNNLNNQTNNVVKTI